MNQFSEPTPVTSRHVAKGLGTTVLARLGAVVEIVAQPLYVLMFGLAGFGIYAVLWAVVNLIENIFDLGMTNALQRAIPQAATPQDAALALRSALAIGVLPCFAAAIGIFFAADQLALLLNVAAKDQAALIPAIKIFIWALPIWAFVEIATSALRARMVFGAEIRLRIFWEQILRLIFAGLFFAGGLGLKGLFLAHLLSLAATALLSLRLIGRHFDMDAMLRAPWKADVARNTFWAGFSVLPANIVGRTYTDAPTLILNMLLPGASGAAAAGLFTIARKYSSVVQMVRTSFAYVMAPLASSATRQDRAQVRDIYAYATRFIASLALPLACVMAAGSGPLLSLFGAQANAAITPLIILLFARAMEAVLGISTPVLQVVAAYRHQLTASLIGLACALVTGFIAANHMNMLNAVTLAMAAGLIVTSAIPLLQLYFIEQLHPFDARFPIVLLRSLGISALAAAATYAISFLPDLASVPLTFAAALATIWISLRFTLPVEDRQSLGKLGRKLRIISSL